MKDKGKAVKQPKIIITRINSRGEVMGAKTVTMLHIIAWVVVAVTVFMATQYVPGDIIRYEHGREDRLMQPVMMDLANHGSLLAEDWLIDRGVRGEGRDWTKMVYTLAGRGAPAAMYWKGKLKDVVGDKAAEARLMSQSAEDGYPRAVEWEIAHPSAIPVGATTASTEKKHGRA